jgi:hypothetical protein
MEFTTDLELQSQTTRLNDTRYKDQANGGLTLSAALFQGTWPGPIVQAPPDHNSAPHQEAQIHNVSYSRFSRPY